MNIAKPWYRSRTVWASIVTIGASIAGLFGLPFAGISPTETADRILQAITALAGFVTLKGRLKALDGPDGKAAKADVQPV